MWTKIAKGRPCHRRTTAAVYRSGSCVALVVPEEMATHQRADVFTDADGRFAFKVHPGGAVAVSRNHSRARTRRIYIPARYADAFPHGTRDADLSSESGMLVLDPRQFQIAAE